MNLKVENLIFAYLVVCVSMIGFNIFCIFRFRRNDRLLKKRSGDYVEIIRSEAEKELVSDEHKSFLMKKLIRVSGLMAFERSLDILRRDNTISLERYLSQLIPVFSQLTLEYCRKNELQAAYFPYLISEYHLLKGEDNKKVKRALFELLKSSSIYSRENALGAFYSIGNSANVADALRIIDRSGYYHHKKLITDGLMSFQGDKTELNRILWERLSDYSLEMQTAILDYIRFSTGDFLEEMMELFSEKYDREINFCAIRYFGKYRYEPAYEHIIKYVEQENKGLWEYTAIACLAISNYPTERSINALKANLNSPIWYVRYNASQSLENMGLEYVDMIDVFESKDRYAGEMMRYRFDQKKIRETEAVKS